MRLQQALLEAIFAHPDDDAPRLIYADWLDEDGDSDRAEFIRVGCARSALRRTDPEWLKLWQRETRLEKAKQDHWLGVPRKQLRTWEWERGFLKSVEGSTANFLEVADELFAWHPIREVKLTAVTPRIGPLAECVYLARLERLSLRWIGHPGTRGSRPGVDELTVLADSPHVSTLTILEFCSWDLHDDGLVILAESPRFEGLRELFWQCRPMTDRGGLALLHSPHLRALQKVYGRREFLSEEVRREMERRFGIDEWPRGDSALIAFFADPEEEYPYR